MYEEAAHWKSVLFIIPKNETRFKIVGSLNILFSKMLGNDGLSETAMRAAFLLPLLVLPRNESDQDKSVNKTLARRIESGIKCGLDSLFKRTKAFKQEIQKAKTFYK